MGRARYTMKGILEQLDDHAEDYTLPMLDNGYTYPGDVRLTAYRDDRRWAILIEALGFFYKLGLPEGIHTDVYAFGNCLSSQASGRQIYPLTWDPVEEETDSSICDVPLAVQVVYIRGEAVPIPRDPAVYAAKGIELEDPHRLHGQHLLRVLLPEHRLALLATEEELRQRVPADLPFFDRRNEWFHPDLAGDEMPSENVTFRKLAEAMVKGDPNRFAIDREPNTHWKNWPTGGTL